MVIYTKFGHKREREKEIESILVRLMAGGLHLAVILWRAAESINVYQPTNLARVHCACAIQVLTVFRYLYIKPLELHRRWLAGWLVGWRKDRNQVHLDGWMDG